MTQTNASLASASEIPWFKRLNGSQAVGPARHLADGDAAPSANYLDDDDDDWMIFPKQSTVSFPNENDVSADSLSPSTMVGSEYVGSWPNGAPAFLPMTNASDGSGVDTAPDQTTTDPSASSPPTSFVAPPAGPDYSALSHAYSNYPVKQEPKWWQRLAAAAAGGAAGWSNAAGRSRNPINIGQMDENILYPGYDQKVGEFESRMLPVEKQAELAGQQQQAWWKNLDALADIQYKQARANYMNGFGRGPSVPVTPEMEAVTGGVFKAGTMIPGSIAAQIAQIAAGRYQKSEPMMTVSDPDFARRLHVTPGSRVPLSVYNTGLTQEGRPTPQTKDLNPADVLMHPKDFDPDIVQRAQQIFDREHKPAIVNVNAGQQPVSAPGNLQLTGDDYLQTVPAGMRGTVKAIAEGRQKALSGYALTKPQGMAIMAAVNQYDPSWSEQRAQLRSAFTTGPEGRNIGNLNTATVHLDRWHEAAKAMANGSWQPGNQLWNYVKTKFGAEAPTNHAFVLNALAGEAANALKGNATDPEIAHVLSTLQPSLSPEQAQGVAEEGLRVLGDKLNTYDERYHQQSSADDPWSPVFPAARAVFQRYGQTPITRPGGTPSANGAVNPNPSGYIVGHVYGGLTYLGGDFRNRASWK